MPSKVPLQPRPPASADQSPTFRKRYDALEQKRDSLLKRLEHIQAAGHTHPGTKRALTLLNQTFRKASVVQRIAVLQAADWLIQVIEMSLPVI